MSEAVAGTEAETADTPAMDAKTTGEKLAAMVEAEAAAAEAETPEDEPDPEDEEKAPEITDPLTLALIEYIGKVQGILGAETPIHPCPYCQGKGFDPMILAKDPHSDICEECQGYGKVATGSFVTGNEVRMCQNCNGSGYKVHGPTAVVAATETPQPEFHVLTPAEVEAIAADARARSAGNVA